MSNTITRQFWLMRKITEKQSLMFSLCACVEQDDDEMYCAAILSMQDQMAAMGRTSDEALDNARLLFMATVDDALAKGRSIQHATGQEAIAIDIPIWQAPKFFHLLKAKLLEQADAEAQQWARLAPATSLESQYV